MTERYISRHRLPWQGDTGTYAVLDLDEGRDVTRGFPQPFAEYLAKCFNAGNKSVIQRFHVEHQFDAIADTLSPQ